MTHVNNAKGAESAEVEEERQLEPAAGRCSAYRFLNAEGSRNNVNSAASQVDAVDSVDTPTDCLEECNFAACQTRAANWHEEFCITDDELEYEDELLFSTTTPSSSAAASTAAATPALECAAALLLGEQQNEQLLMEGILACCCCCYVNYATHRSGNLDTRERENSLSIVM